MLQNKGMIDIMAASNNNIFQFYLILFSTIMCTYSYFFLDYYNDIDFVLNFHKETYFGPFENHQNFLDYRDTMYESASEKYIIIGFCTLLISSSAMSMINNLSIKYRYLYVHFIIFLSIFSLMISDPIWYIWNYDSFWTFKTIFWEYIFHAILEMAIWMIPWHFSHYIMNRYGLKASMAMYAFLLIFIIIVSIASMQRNFHFDGLIHVFIIFLYYFVDFERRVISHFRK